PDLEKRRKISIRNVRLVKRYLNVFWNGTDFRVVSDASGDLVYEYPLVVRNRGTVARSISARMERTEGRYGSALITPLEAVVGPGDSARFTATLRLPKSVASTLPVFSCEWYQPVFAVKGAVDSDEGILRSCKRIPLPLIIMPKERGADAVFGQNIVPLIRQRYASTDWGKKEGDSIITQAKGLLAGNLTIPDGPGWAAAYYYCEEHRCGLQYQGPGKHFCPVGKEYRTKDFAGVSLDRDYATSRHEALARGARPLALAYVLTGDARFARAALSIMEQYKAKYFTWDWMDLDTATNTIDKGRIQFAKYMETYPFRSMVESLEFLRASGGVDAEQARGLERGLLLPALAEMGDFRMDMICRETSIVITTLTGGLAWNNAPLVAFSLASPFGYWSLRRYGATADGLVHGHGYAQNHFAKNVIDMAEMMYRNGRDTFDPELKRLADCSFWWSVPMNPAGAADIFTVTAGGTIGSDAGDLLIRTATNNSIIAFVFGPEYTITAHMGAYDARSGGFYSGWHMTGDVGKSTLKWNNATFDNYIIVGTSAFEGRDVLEEIVNYELKPKKPGMSDYMNDRGLVELDPHSLPPGTGGESVRLDELVSYNYKVNYEQQLKINALEKRVQELKVERARLQTVLCDVDKSYSWCH
ncbi:MAG: hypothetical protein V1744_03145, partial [Candidatus Altiarchaeota archaeon]